MGFHVGREGGLDTERWDTKLPSGGEIFRGALVFFEGIDMYTPSRTQNAVAVSL